MSEDSPQSPPGQSTNDCPEGIVKPENRISATPNNVPYLMIVSINDPGIALQRLLDAFPEEIVGRFYPVGFPVESI
jgi:hypothetical protein